MASSSIAQKIDAKGKTINSGFCSGNQSFNSEMLKGPSGVCRGTVRSYCHRRTCPVTSLPGKVHDSGALSGGSRRAGGTVNDQQAQHPDACACTDGRSSVNKDSQVIGTLQSFNVGSSPSQDRSFIHICVSRALIDADGIKTAGTRGSFNATDGSTIVLDGAIINSGCGAGNNDEVNNYLLNKEQRGHFKGYKCWGTVESFNANGTGKTIEIKHARLNTGAFAGIAMSEQVGPSRRKMISYAP